MTMESQRTTCGRAGGQQTSDCEVLAALAILAGFQGGVTLAPTDSGEWEVRPVNLAGDNNQYPAYGKGGTVEVAILRAHAAQAEAAGFCVPIGEPGSA
ncbi:hypothetical protein LMG2828_05918 [Achromobacter piechaudii]|nr:hypothetical protein LMG2828_05918 [Achromobacter piechaudii]